METGQLIGHLQYFYSLEIQQAEMYNAQSNGTDDLYASQALSRIAEIELEHSENLSRLIRKLGGVPTILGDVLGQITGRISGGITKHAGLDNMLKLNITVEEKAMADYKDLILKVNDRETFTLLWNHLIDEDLHTAWFAHKIARTH